MARGTSDRAVTRLAIARTTSGSLTKLVNEHDYVKKRRRQPARVGVSGRAPRMAAQRCLGLVRVGVSDLAELIQDLAQQSEVAGAKVCRALREDLGRCRDGHLGGS